LKSVQNDSSIIILNFEKFNVQINSSWEYGHKDRICTFEFDKGLLIWDDNSMGLDVRFEIGDLTQFSFFVSHFLYDSPLKDSLHTFLNTNNFDYEKQKKITLDVITNLQKNYENTI
jgi:predicted dehydrogenase